MWVVATTPSFFLRHGLPCVPLSVVCDAASEAVMLPAVDLLSLNDKELCICCRNLIASAYL